MKVNHFHTLSKGILSNKDLPVLLGMPIKRYSRSANEVHSLVCWGYKPTSHKAEKLANKRNLNLVRLEDGFITHLPNCATKLSVCSDSLGMHYSEASDLHKLCTKKRSIKQLERARSAIAYKNTHYISKYNHNPVTTFNQLKTGKQYVLIADQISDDESVKHSRASIDTYLQMIKDALEQNKEHEILINVHPDNKKKKPFSSLIPDVTRSELLVNERVHFITTPINAMQLIKQCSHVYTISSLIGFEAVLMDKTVKVYGTPFYAGYGLTEDVKAHFKTSLSKEAVFYAAYIDYCTYINPFSEQKCEIEDVMEIIAANIRCMPLTQVIIKKPSLWKRNFIKRFLSHYSLLEPAFSSDFYNAEWGYTRDSDCPLSIEDGFVRSVGLGSSLTLPSSLVIDKGGIYYDFLSDSELQHILNNKEFTQRELERSEKIIDYLREHKISKYNLSNQAVQTPTRPYVLVPGQVETDKSLIASGCGYKNADAVKIAKERYPNHLIVYRPHPDVVYNGVSQQDETRASDLADITTTQGDIIQWIENASGVVTITSNSGFEAILRDIPVYCLGYPYYYGYGLTQSEVDLPNRRRKLDIFMLVAGVLIRYPRYIDNESGLFCRVEEILSKLQSSKRPDNIASSRFIRLIYKTKYLLNL